MFESYLCLALSWNLMQVPAFLGPSVSLSHLCVRDNDQDGLMDSCEILFVSGLFVAQYPTPHEVSAWSRDSTHMCLLNKMKG